jgi:hypothetical protein
VMLPDVKAPISDWELSTISNIKPLIQKVSSVRSPAQSPTTLLTKAGRKHPHFLSV